MNKTSHERWYFDPHSLRSTSTPYLPGCEVKTPARRTGGRRWTGPGVWLWALASASCVLAQCHSINAIGPEASASQHQVAPQYQYSSTKTTTVRHCCLKTQSGTQRSTLFPTKKAAWTQCKTNKMIRTCNPARRFDSGPCDLDRAVCVCVRACVCVCV